MGKRTALFVNHKTKQLAEFMLDFFFQRMECPACRCEAGGLCSVCQAEIRPWGEFIFEGIQGHAMVHYSTAAKNLIYNFKKGLSYDAMVSLFAIMDDHLGDIKWDEYDCIVPVTSIKTNLKARGFDPAVLLARHLAKSTGLPLVNCIKNKGTQAHKSMNHSQRMASSKTSFEVRRGWAGKIKGQRILLFDDVMTSGATILAVAQLLKSHGAKQVEFLVVERSTA